MGPTGVPKNLVQGKLRLLLIRKAQCVLLEGEYSVGGASQYIQQDMLGLKHYTQDILGFKAQILHLSNYCQRSRRDEAEGQHVKGERTGSRLVKPKIKILIVGLGLCWLQQKFLFLKILACIHFNKANLFSEHLLNTCYMPGVALSINIP